MLNYQTVDFLKSQLQEQYDRSGYSYKRPQDVDRILEAQAAKLAAAGVSSIYDIGLKEVPNTNTINQVFRIGNDLYYRQEEDEGPGYNVKIDPSRVLDIAADTPVREETDSGEPIFQDRFQVTIAEDPTKYLINKQTGQEIPKIGLKSNWKKDPTAFNISKPEPIVSRNGYERYGFDTSVEGMAEYSVQFVDGNPLFLPVYKSTKTDLTPYLAMAAVVAAPYLVGTTAAPAASGAGTAGAGTAGTAGAGTAGTGTAISGAGLTSAEMAALKGAEGYGAGLLGAGTAISGAGLTSAEMAALKGSEAAYGAASPGMAISGGGLTSAEMQALKGAEAYGPGASSGVGVMDALRTANVLNSMLTQPTVQQQAGLLGGGGGQARGVDYSGLLPANKVRLLPLAEPYRRSLL